MKCTNCDEDIDEDEDQIVEAIIDSSLSFCHLHCFRCSICHEQLTGWYLEKNGQLYCRKDYYHKYGERCRHCHNVMSGPVMVVGGEIKFHPECFQCDFCSSIIGDDESYAFMEQSKLYCNQCFQKRTNESSDPLQSSVRFQRRQSSAGNVVQEVIEIPPLSNGRQRRIRLALRDYHCVNSHNCGCNHSNRRNSKININLFNSNDTCVKTDCVKIPESSSYLQCKIQRAYCFNSANSQSSSDTSALSNVLHPLNSNGTGAHISEIDVNYDLDLLHIGDRILELNGVSIKDKSLKEIEHLIEKSRDQVICLTIEHNHASQARHSTLNSSSSLAYNSDSVKLPSNNLPSEPFFTQNGCTRNNSGQNSEYCDVNLFNVGCAVGEPAVSSNDSNEHATLQSDLSLPRCYAITNSSEKQANGSNPSGSFFANSITCLNKASARTSAALPPSIGSIATTDTPNGTKYPIITPSKSMDNNRKSRSLEKRQRNRERSSSLSRLLESIRLSSESSHSQNCDSTLASPFNNIANNLSMTHSQSSSYFSPPRNGFPSKSNNSLSRTKSFRVEPKSYRIFRANDLVKGALLGKGFFGEVFEVTDKVTKEKMVLKELYHNDREAEANFVREVSILKSLSHKNVLQFIGILYRGKKLNLITEYITGGTLRQLIQVETRPIYWPERINWARDIASGVNYLHSMNLIHRDLNSQNCLVREDGTVVVADFGLSKITSVNNLPPTPDNNENGDLNSQQIQKLNRRRDRRKRYTIVGNPFWMAPEMMHRNKYDERVDIYSFGIILLEIIGSVNADPDVLRRNRDFSVDRKYFLDNYVKNSCPEIFWKIAFLCTEMNPDLRPPFHVLERWFQIISNSLLSLHSTANNVNCTSELTLSSTSYYKLIPSDIVDEVASYSNTLANMTLNSAPLSSQTSSSIILSDPKIL